MDSSFSSCHYSENRLFLNTLEKSLLVWTVLFLYNKNVSKCQRRPDKWSQVNFMGSILYPSVSRDRKSKNAPICMHFRLDLSYRWQNMLFWKFPINSFETHSAFTSGRKVITLKKKKKKVTIENNGSLWFPKPRLVSISKVPRIDAKFTSWPRSQPTQAGRGQQMLGKFPKFYHVLN